MARGASEACGFAWCDELRYPYWDETHPFAADRRHKTGWAPDSIEHAEFTALWLERIEGAPDPHLDRPKLLAKPANSFIVEDEITTPEEREFLPYYQEIARPGHREWFASVKFVRENQRGAWRSFAKRGKDPLT